MAVDLPRYVSLLKNLRAVVFFDPSHPPEGELGWIRRKYRYRRAGVSEGLLEALPEETKSILGKKPFEILDHPVVETKRFVEALSSFVEEPPYVLDSLVLASCYVNPMLVLGRGSFQLLRPFASWCMSSTAELPDVEIKRNLRIVGYAILDFHEKVISLAYEFLKGFSKRIDELGRLTEAESGEIENFIQERSKLAETDGKQRFWRLRREGKKLERPVIAYLDPLIPLRNVMSKKEAIELMRRLPLDDPNLSMALSLIPTLILQL